MALTPTITIKRGDDFKLELTVTDTNTTEALAAATALADAQVILDAAIAADPQVAQDIVDAQVVVDAAQIVYDDAIIVDITSWTILSQVRWRGTLIDDLIVTITNALVGTFNLTIGPVETALWAARNYSCDIQFTIPSTGVVSSQTFIIEVEKDVTF